MLKALIFDVDGTLADTESAHLAAFNQAFAQEGLDWFWDEALYTELLTTSGGKERMLHYARSTPARLAALGEAALQDEIERIHQVKNTIYHAMIDQGLVHLRPGVQRLIEAAREQRLTLAIATTTSPHNVWALMQSALGQGWRRLFSVVEDAGTAAQKKPHPQVYQQALQRLELQARECLAFEDSANGLRAARAAGLATVVTPCRFTAHHRFEGALRVLTDLTDASLADLRRWHEAYFAASPHP
jgi:HAD superfamily hydrolase (TIGR01509 family)